MRYTTLHGFVFLVALFAPLSASVLAADTRIVQSVDLGWRFYLGDVAEAKSAAFADAPWRTLDVPHDWSIEGEYSAANPTGDRAGYLPSGIGWYRRVIAIPQSWRGRVVTLEFEGVYMNSDVWLNGEHVGGRPYGYSTFTCDLTPHLKSGNNVVSVRVDNTLEPSPLVSRLRHLRPCPPHRHQSGTCALCRRIRADPACQRAIRRGQCRRGSEESFRRSGRRRSAGRGYRARRTHRR